MRGLTKFKASGFGSIDREEGIIRGVSLIHGNQEALGHEMFIDIKMVNQVVALGKETGDVGLKARFDHPSACFSSMGSHVGRFKNFRRKGDKGLADLHIADFAASSPQGDLRTHLLDVAEEDPGMVGFSIVFRPGEPEVVLAKEGDDPESPEFMFPHARVDSLHACDVVDEPAANPDGLFSVFGRPNYMAEQIEAWAEENPELLQQIMTPVLKVYNENINLKSIKMSDDKKTLLEQIKDLLPSKSKEDKTPVVEDAPVVEVNEELEAKTAELAQKDDEIAALKVDLETQKVEFETKSGESETVLGEAKTAIEELTGEVDGLKKKLNESIGGTVDAVAETEDIDTSDEATEERKEKNKDEQRSEWINDGFGNSKSDNDKK